MMAAQYWNTNPSCYSYPQSGCFLPFDNHLTDFARDNQKQLAVKVEYEGSCRRFSCGFVDGYWLDLDMPKLKSRIIKLFDLDEVTSFTISYSDSDNEWITFSSDEELRDAVLHQCLNPLRVRIAMNISAPDPPIDDYICESEKADAIPISGTRLSVAASASEHDISATTAAQKTDRIRLDMKPAETDRASKSAAEHSESFYDTMEGSQWRNALRCPRAEYSGTHKAQTKLGWETKMGMLDVLEGLGFYDVKSNKRALKNFDYDLERTIAYLTRTSGYCK